MAHVGHGFGAEFLRSDFIPVVDRYWVALGLKTAHILTQPLWRKNLVTGVEGGFNSGTGVTFPNRLLRTPGAANNGGKLPHNLGANPAAYSIAVGSKHISGSVDWSMMKSGQWGGCYSGGGGSVSTTKLASFDGGLNCGGDGFFAFAFRGANKLVGYGRGGIRGEDLECQYEADLSNNNVHLGWANSDSPAVAELSHFFVFLGGLRDEALQLLAYDPTAIFLRNRRNKVFYAPAATGLPTLTSLGISSITTTGAILTTNA